MGQITAALSRPAVPLMASYRAQFSQSKTHLCRDEGERRRVRLNEVKCMAGNLSWALTWQEASYRGASQQGLTIQMYNSAQSIEEIIINTVNE